MPKPSRRGISPTLTRLGLALLLPLAASLAFAQNIALEAQELGVPLCISDAHTLCLNGDRFSVTAAYQLTPSGPSILASAVRLTGDTGYFWFFDETNVELVVKVLNGCVDPYNSYWFFAAGLTNLAVGIEVRDLKTGDEKTYSNPLGTPFVPIQDTNAFRTCP